MNSQSRRRGNVRVLPPQRDWPGSEVPEPESRAHRRVTALVAIAAVTMTVLYLGWRVLFTIDATSALLGIPLLVLEFWAFLSALMHAVVLWDLDAIPPASRRESTDKRVVVLIPTYNEPPEVLMPTLLGARGIRLADQVWVLDDGTRDWVRDACDDLGLVWRTRNEHEDAKAGNINAALPDIDADLIVVLDADHVASRDLLSHTIGYFDDPRVALVQTPQDFFNQESFEHDVLGDRIIGEEDLFYRAMAAGRNRWNAAFWVGTGAVIRLDALRSIGGVATSSITEDIQTTIALHRAGWRTVHHNEVLARGLAAADADQYLTQRYRWGTGAMQVLRNERFMTRPGLTFAQRICYLSTLMGWWDSWRILALLLLPPISLLLASFPFSTTLTAFILFFGASFTLQQFAMWRLTRRRSTPRRSMIFDAIKLPATLRATLTIFSRRPRRFEVTDKGRRGSERIQARVPLLLPAVLAVELAAIVTFGITIVVAPTRLENPWIAALTVVWLLFNTYIVIMAIRRIRDSRFAGERRSSVRLQVDGEGSIGSVPVRIQDLSLGGARLLGGTVLPTRGIFDLQIGHRSLMVIVTRSEPGADGRTVTQVQFLPGQELLAADVVSPLLVASRPDGTP